MSRIPPDTARLRARDPKTTDALRRLVRAHVRGYFSRQSQVHDVTQDALLELLAKLEAGARPRNPIHWALTAAHNAVRRELTRVRRCARAVEYESWLHGGRDLDQAALLDAREDLRRVEALLGSWDEAPQQALAGAALGDDHRELAELLGVSPGAARMTLSRARAQLSQRFTAQQKLGRLVALARQAKLTPSG